MKRLVMLFLVSGLAISGCGGDDDDGSTDGDGGMVTAPSISVEWRPVDHSVGSWMFFRAELTIENGGTGELGSEGWHLYFSSVRRFLADGEGDDSARQDLTGQGIAIRPADEAESGDYFVLEPLSSFEPLGPGERRTLSLLAQFWATHKSDAPAGFHIVFDGDGSSDPVAVAVPAKVEIDPSDPLQTTKDVVDVLPVPTARLRHAENAAFQATELQDQLLPLPRDVQPGTGQMTLQGAITIERPADLASEADYLAAALGDVLDASITVQDPAAEPSGTVRLGVNPDNLELDLDGDNVADPEAYVLDVTDDHVAIEGSDAAGVFYGLQTLRQLVPAAAYLAAADPAGRPGQIDLAAVHIADAPGFSYRGMHLDVARHFQSKETVMKLLDLMAHLKLNKFHLHAGDDEGWRIEIPGLPELTDYGARRGFDLAEGDMLHVGLGSGSDLAADDGITGKAASPAAANGGVQPVYQGFENATLNFVGSGSGFYTAQDFEEILAYATERHISVIPEFDMPGHARAAVKAMERRYRTYSASDPDKASEFRLIDPADTSEHTSVQGYTDNVVNPCLDSTYAFLELVVSEIAARYDAAGAPLEYIHMGGDEVGPPVWWQDSPACAANAATAGMTDPDLYNYFFTRYHTIVTDTGARTTGWSDVLHHGLSLEGFVPMPWSNVWTWGLEDESNQLANQGVPVILSHATNLYMDLAYNKDPDEPGYYWANYVDTRKTFEYRPFDIFANAGFDRMGNPLDPAMWAEKVRLTDAGKANILGMHGLLWSENVKTPELLEYFAFPKVLGIAERAWNPDPPAIEDMAAAWARFANSLGQHVLPRLGAYRAVDRRGELPADGIGVNYRIPLPGAVIENGMLDANVEYPGLAVEYSTDAGATWTAYTGPVAVSGQVVVRTRAPDGRTSRVAPVE